MNDKLKNLIPKQKTKLIRVHPDFDKVIRDVFPDVPMPKITKRLAMKIREKKPQLRNDLL
jgi:hypothetical protein